MKKYLCRILVVCLLPFFFLSGAAGETLEIPGTGACEILLGKLAEEFNRVNPGDAVSIPPSVGSSGGIRLVGEGKNYVGRVARPLKEHEKKYGLTYKVFAKDPVLFAVSRKVGVEKLTRKQLLELYSGKINNWAEVGGNDLRVRLLIREPDDSSFLIIKENIPAFQNLRFPDHAKSLYHDSEMVEMLQKYSTVIGWLTGSSCNTIREDVIPVSLDGVEPTAANIQDGKYALSGDYAVIYKEGELTPLASKFLDFLFSRKAARLLEDEGVIPVRSR